MINIACPKQVRWLFLSAFIHLWEITPYKRYGSSTYPTDRLTKSEQWPKTSCQQWLEHVKSLQCTHFQILPLSSCEDILIVVAEVRDREVGGWVWPGLGIYREPLTCLLMTSQTVQHRNQMSNTWNRSDKISLRDTWSLNILLGKAQTMISW